MTATESLQKLISSVHLEVFVRFFPPVRLSAMNVNLRFLATPGSMGIRSVHQRRGNYVTLTGAVRKGCVTWEGCASMILLLRTFILFLHSLDQCFSSPFLSSTFADYADLWHPPHHDWTELLCHQCMKQMRLQSGLCGHRICQTQGNGWQRSCRSFCGTILLQ